jgi:hypothetical protein
MEAALVVLGGRGLVARARSARAVRGYVVFIAAFAVLFLADGSRQPTSGPGWRILGYQRGVAGPSQAAVIGTQAALDAAWDRMLIRTPPAQLPADATTFWVTATGTLGCPAHLAGVRGDGTSIAAVFTLALTFGCDALKVPDSFLVAVDRNRLPAAPYRFARLGPDGQPPESVEIAP